MPLFGGGKRPTQPIQEGVVLGGISYTAREVGDDLVVTIRVNKRNLKHLKQVVDDLLVEYLEAERDSSIPAGRRRAKR